MSASMRSTQPEVFPVDDLYVLKFGGNAIRGRDDMLRLSREIAELIRGGDRIILVHGGGPEISEEMERRGMTPARSAGSGSPTPIPWMSRRPC